MADGAELHKIGIFGGTFDPVHNAHLSVARLAAQAAGLHRVIFMPAGAPPHKQARALLAPEHRLAMVRLAVRCEADFQVSELEIVTPGVDFTVDTLRLFGKENPAARLYFLIGADSLMALDQWRDPGELLSLAAFVAVYRPECSMEALEQKRLQILHRFGGEILLVGCAGQAISSTDIRRKVAAGQDISGLVPPAVLDYIRRHGLYLEGI
jgi:nicotinate-nucleotide adenylyltransferase